MLARAIPAQVNPIQIENSQPGTPNWTLAPAATNREIEGYADLTSVNLGGTINFFVSETNLSDTAFTLEIFRSGYYSGAGARLMLTVGNLPLFEQTPPVADPDGVIRCHWNPSYTLTVPTSWTSGIYLARLTDQSGYQSYIIFVVRDDASHSQIVYESAVTTYQAYNFWPGDTNLGKSLYGFAPAGEATKVSFDRPYGLGMSYVADVQASYDAAVGVGAGEYLLNLAPGPYSMGPYNILPFGYEYNMVRWLEKNGYDVTYITDIDHHENAAVLTNHAVYLSGGHNEYWSMEMRNNLQNAMQAGLNAAFLGSNAIYWQIRLEDSDRTVVCYKRLGDPHEGMEDDTVEWRNLTQPPLPEAALIGVEYFGDPVENGAMLMYSATSNHFLRANISATQFAGLLGYEVDGEWSDSPANTMILASTSMPAGTLVHYSNDSLGSYCQTQGCNANMTWYTDPTYGYYVFATGSMYWSWGLDDFFSTSNPQSANPHTDYTAQDARQLTANVLFNTMSRPDDFGSPQQDPARWSLAVVEPLVSPSPYVTVQQGNGQLIIQPANRPGLNYSGYLSQPAVNLTNGSFSVQVAQVANVGSILTDTSFILYNADTGNLYRIIEEGGQLYFQFNGSGPSIAYDPSQHAYWRFRHDPQRQLIVFETSSSDSPSSVWTQQYTANIDNTAVSKLFVNLNAGTYDVQTAGSPAIFSNLHRRHN
jgi:hypothetical protein